MVSLNLNSINSSAKEKYKFLLNAKLRCNIEDTKSPNLKVPSFLIYLSIRIERTSVLNWKPIIKI